MAKRKNSVAASPFKSEDDWRGESDHRTLTEANTITNDPARMKGVMAHQTKAVNQVKAVHESVVDSGIRKTKEYKKVMSSLHKRNS